MYRFVYLLFGLILIPYTSVFAAPTDGSNSNPWSSGLVIFQLILYLAIVLLLIYFFFWFLAKKRTFTTGNLYKHLGGIPLGQNKSVQILEIGGKVYVLGVGENIQLIHLIDNDEDIEGIYQSANLRESKDTKLTNWLKGLKKANSSGRFELELTEKIEQLKDRRIQSVNQILDESDEGVEKRGQHE